MSRKRNHRMARRVLGPNPLAHLMAIQGAAYLSADDALRRAETVRLAVEDIATGHAGDCWRIVCDACNMLEEFIRHGVCRGDIDGAQCLIADILDRQRDTGTRALHAAELQGLRDLAAVYADAVASCTHSQYFAAQRGVEDRVRRILSGETIPASLRVVSA